VVKIRMFYQSMCPIQVIPFMFSLRCINVYVQSLLHSCKTHFKPGISIPPLLGLLAYSLLDRWIKQGQWLTTFIDSTIYNIKGCHTINKQFSIDSFLDRKVIPGFNIFAHTLSSNHSIRLTIDGSASILILIGT